MSPFTAASRALSEISLDSRIKIVAVSGPGEPLANPETFETFELIRKNVEDTQFCLCTNGTLLSGNVSWLGKMGFRTVTVSMSTANPSTAARIYEWAYLSKNRVKGKTMGELIVQSQLQGISKAVETGLTVKVNTILIPGFNQGDIIELAEAVAHAGASMQNIVPIVPNDKVALIQPPTKAEVEESRKRASDHIEQFRYCRQCRSDVVGLPGCDVVL